MKFGKLIADAQQLSAEAWRPGFMDYKALKQVLKGATRKPEGVLPTALASQLGECISRFGGRFTGAVYALFVYVGFGRQGT